MPYLNEFKQILEEHGISSENLIRDGQLHRTATHTKPHKKNAAYIIHNTDPALLWWCNWETGNQGTYSPKNATDTTANQAKAQERLAGIRKQQRLEQELRHEEAKDRAASILQSCLPCTHSEYLQRKKLPIDDNIFQGRNGELIIPILSESESVQSLQRIFPDGKKRFLTGGKINGGFFYLGKNPEKVIYLCEGYATAASIYLASKETTYLSFSAHNLKAVALFLRKKYPQIPIIICADADEAGQKNAGACLTITNLSVVTPSFLNVEGSDFNDLHLSQGLGEVSTQIEAAYSTHIQAQKSQALCAIKLGDFLEMPLPERGFLLKPVIPTQGLVIMYAPRGIGKTFAALSMALAISGGGEIFEWRASNQSRVLYVDGEMPARAMQERLAYLAMGNNVPPNATNNLVLVTPDIQPCPMPDLSTYAGQQALEPLLKDISLLVLDNIATLCRTGKENEAQSWQNMQSWLLDLRRRGIAVLLIHHAGKSGDQRGTSAREDIMDTVISLRRPKQYKMTEGARFEVHLTKARGISGEDVKPFEALLCSEKESFYWKIKDIEDAELDELKALLSEGLSIRDCAEEMGKSKSAVHRLKKKLEAMS